MKAMNVDSSKSKTTYKDDDKDNDKTSSTSSLYYLRPEVATIKDTLIQFVMNECIPAEKEYEIHMSTRYGNDRWTMNAIPSCIEQLKQRAKELGLWNLFLSQHLCNKIKQSNILLSNYDDNKSCSSSNHNHHNYHHNILPSIPLSYREYGILCEIMGTCTPIAAEVCNCNAPDTGNIEVLIEYGTIQQQKQYLIPLLHGTIRSTFLMTEPNIASSDPTNLETKLMKVAIISDQKKSKTTSSSSSSSIYMTNHTTSATTTTNHNQQQEYEYYLSGTKWWSTGAMDPRCQCAFIVAKIDYTHPSLLLVEQQQQSKQQQQQQSKQQQKLHNAHTIVIVPLPHPNIRMIRPLTVFGYDDAPHGHAEVVLQNVMITSQNIIVGESYGFHIAQARLGPGRIHHCMRAVGIASRCYELMIRRSLERQTFGKYLWEHGGVQEMIADSYADIEAARLLTLSCADIMDHVGVKNARQQIAMIKVMVPKLTYNVVDRAIQIFGGAGVSNDTILAKSLVGLRTLRIADGPDAVHQRTVARLEVQKMKDQEKKRGDTKHSGRRSRL